MNMKADTILNPTVTSGTMRITIPRYGSTGMKIYPLISVTTDGWNMTSPKKPGISNRMKATGSDSRLSMTHPLCGTSNKLIRKNIFERKESLINEYKKTSFGNPSYKKGDLVIFKFSRTVHGENGPVNEDREIIGALEIIDAYGTFEQEEEASYDIYVQKENALYKHVVESAVVRKVRAALPEERMRWMY